MASYGKVYIGIRKISRLRGDAETNKKGQTTDGGYAGDSFFVETEVIASEISPEKMKKILVQGAQKVVKQKLSHLKIKSRRK